MAAVLANWGGYYSQRVYLSEARRMGLLVRAPHVNHSGRNFVVCREPLALFKGLDQIKVLTRGTIERIIRNRPFTSIEDFLSRADPRPQEAEKLVRVGALDGLGSIPSILRRLQGSGTKWQAGQMNLFGWNEPDGDDWTTMQKMDAQQELLGVSLAAHPLEMVIDKITAARAISSIDAAGRVGQRVTIAGIRQASHRSRTAKGESMMFLTIEDLSGTMDVILFPNVYHQAKHIVTSNSPFLITGQMEMDVTRGEPSMRAEKVTRLDDQT